MKKSKFAHIIPIKDMYVYYNSLFMNPVYLSCEEHGKLIDGINDKTDISNELKETLIENKIFVENDNDDEKLLEFAKSKIMTPYPSIVYFILSEKCNLACKYCFLGNAKKRTIDLDMTKEIANKALEYYSYQIRQKPQWYNHRKEFIFYGGEPLMNFDVMKYVIEQSQKMQKEKLLPEDIKYSLITNGLLLDEEKISYLKKNNILTSISVDGSGPKENISRVDKQGKPIYDRLIGILKLVKKHEWNVGLSITLTQETIENQEGIFELLHEYDIHDICFNILYSTEDYYISSGYYEKVNDFIIEFYKKARNCGIYEERIMRKIDTFVKGKVYYSDCAATSGSQIVIAPDGRVGVCHGCLEKKEYFECSVNDREVLDENLTFCEWSQITPLNNEECYECEALGICGGGCPINAKKNSDSGELHSIDQAFCIHSKKILKFMLEDLIEN